MLLFVYPEKRVCSICNLALLCLEGELIGRIFEWWSGIFGIQTDEMTCFLVNPDLTTE